MRKKSEVVSDLRKMLADLFVAKEAGETYARLARAHGYVDGYMRAILEVGVISKEELLAVVASERTKVAGPATREDERFSESDYENEDEGVCAA